MCREFARGNRERTKSPWHTQQTLQYSSWPAHKRHCPARQLLRPLNGMTWRCFTMSRVVKIPNLERCQRKSCVHFEKLPNYQLCVLPLHDSHSGPLRALQRTLFSILRLIIVSMEKYILSQQCFCLSSHSPLLVFIDNSMKTFPMLFPARRTFHGVFLDSRRLLVASLLLSCARRDLPVVRPSFDVRCKNYGQEADAQV